MENQLSVKVSCATCYNLAPMEILGRANDVELIDIPEGPTYQEGFFYEVLKCPKCSKVNIAQYFWNDFMDGSDDNEYKIIYPQNKRFPEGLPDDIKKTLEVAEKIKTIDAEIYAITLRKVLELVCIDKAAKGKVLAAKIQNLATRGEIPIKLVAVAKGLKEFGNIGAHAGTGGLSVNEIPIAEALCRAVLEYIYSAPYLAKVAESKLEEIKAKKTTAGRLKSPFKKKTEL
jgi:hypothetical protein